MDHSSILLFLMLAHFFADFIFQTRWMADHKSKSLNALTLHVLIYTTVVTLCAILKTRSIYTVEYCWFFAANFVMHWITDFITSKLSVRFYTNGNMSMFWRTIGFDQYIHFVCLWWTSLMWLC